MYTLLLNCEYSVKQQLAVTLPANDHFLFSTLSDWIPLTERKKKDSGEPQTGGRREEVDGDAARLPW